MNIGVIGSGNIGANAAKLFAAAGHQVAISNSRGPETLEGLVEEIGPGVRAATVEEAAEFGEVVVEAIPFGRFGASVLGTPSAGSRTPSPRSAPRSAASTPRP